MTYVPTRFRLDDRDALLDLAETHDFATIVSACDGEPRVSHAPVLLRRDGPDVTIAGHLARANRHTASLDGASPTVIVFHGPHAYVSPRWYASSEGAVPTWNYAAVYAHGRPRVVEDEEAVLRSLADLVARHEAHRPDPWTLDELTAARRRELLRSLVAFEMPVERLEGKFKLNQDRTRKDREGVAAALEGEGFPGVARLMREHGG